MPAQPGTMQPVPWTFMVKRSYTGNECSKCPCLYFAVGRVHILRHFSGDVVQVKDFIDARDVSDRIEHCACGVLMVLVIPDVSRGIGIRDVYPYGRGVTAF